MGQMTKTKRAKSPQERSGNGADHPLVSLRKKLESRKRQFEKEMVRGINLDAQIGAAIAMVGASKQLMGCTHESIVAAVYEATRLGVLLIPAAKQAYLVPFGLSAQLIIDFRGYLAISTSSGMLKDLGYELVYQSDHFKRIKLYVGGEDKSRVEFEPRDDLLLSERGDILGVLVEFKFPDGSCKLAYLPTERIERIRKAAPSAKHSSPWDTHWEEMAAKTAIKWGFKLIPMPLQVAEALAVDDHFGSGDEPLFSGDTITIDPETGEVLDVDSGDDTPEEVSAEPAEVEPAVESAVNAKKRQSRAAELRNRAAEI